MRRLWITIANNETAEQAVRDGRKGALMCAGLFASLAVDAWWFYRDEGAAVAAFFAVLYIFAAWRIHHGSAELMDLAMICIPLGTAAIWRVPAMQVGRYWCGLAPFLLVLIGFQLLNGVRGASYLHAPLGLRRRDGGETPGTLAPNSPLRPRDA